MVYNPLEWGVIHTPNTRKYPPEHAPTYSIYTKEEGVEGIVGWFILYSGFLRDEMVPEVSL